MRIVCPNCSAAYDVPDGLLTGRKAVSCARCGQEWRPAEAVAEAVAEAHAVPEPEQQVVTWLEPAAPPPRPQPIWPPLAETPARERRGRLGGDRAIDRLMAAPPPPPSPGLALLLGWAVSIALVLVLAGALYVWREDVMAAWPPSTRLYAALGLAGPIR